MWGLLLLGCSVQAQTITQTTFDSVWNQTLPLSDQLRQVDSLIISIDPHLNDLPLKQAQKALTKAKKAKLTTWIDRLSLSIGSIYSSIDIQDSSRIYLLNALEGLQKSKDKLYIPNAHKELSWLYTYLPEYDKALEYAFLALEGYEALEDGEQVAVLKSRIAQIWAETEQPTKVLPL